MRARVRPRLPRLVAAFAAIGCGTPTAIAERAGLDHKSVSRAIEGEQIGERFIAATTAVLQRPEYQPLLAEIGIPATLDSLFEITTEPSDG